MGELSYAPLSFFRANGWTRSRDGINLRTAKTCKYCVKELNGAQSRNRTSDTAIFNRLLYRLSYLGIL